MKLDDFKTRLTIFAGGAARKLKKLPHHYVIPCALIVLVILLVGFKLAVGFHHYQQRTTAAALRSLHAAGASDAANELNQYGAQAAAAYGTIAPPLPALSSVPANLEAGAVERTVTCPGASPNTAVIATVSAVLEAPSSVAPGCIVSWRFYSQTEESDAGFGHIQGLINGQLVNMPTGEIVGMIASGTPAATIVATIDNGNAINLVHHVNGDLDGANGAAIGTGWHSYAIEAKIIGTGTGGGAGADWTSPKPLTVRLMAGANPAIPYWPGATSAAASNPHIAQQAPIAGAVAGGAAEPAPVIVAAPVHPPTGVQAGKVERKVYQADSFGNFALVTTSVESAQALTVTAPARVGNAPAQRVEWSGWIKLDQPESVAVLRLAGGQGTIGATVDGMPLGQPQERWPQSAPTTQTASVSLSPGWHQFAITNDEQAGTWGDGASIQLALGNGTAEPQPPQPWAVPARAEAAASIPHIAQQTAAASASSTSHPVHADSPKSRNNQAAKPVGPTTTGATK